MNPETAIGGMFIERLCEKTYHDRRLVMKVDLDRTADQKGREFTGSTRFEIYERDSGRGRQKARPFRFPVMFPSDRPRPG